MEESKEEDRREIKDKPESYVHLTLWAAQYTLRKSHHLLGGGEVWGRTEEGSAGQHNEP
jgi:hypothetical protein